MKKVNSWIPNLLSRFYHPFFFLRISGRSVVLTTSEAGLLFVHFAARIQGFSFSPFFESKSALVELLSDE